MTDDFIEWMLARSWGERVLSWIPHWAFIGWWQYIFRDLPEGPFFGRRFLIGRRWYGTSKWDRIVCRLRGHPRGEVFYNPGGDEPNHDCKDCGDNLG